MDHINHYIRQHAQEDVDFRKSIATTQMGKVVRGIGKEELDGEYTFFLSLSKPKQKVVYFPRKVWTQIFLSQMCCLLSWSQNSYVPNGFDQQNWQLLLELELCLPLTVYDRSQVIQEKETTMKYEIRSKNCLCQINFGE